MTISATPVEAGVNGNICLHVQVKAYTPGGLHTAICIIDPPLCVRRSQGAINRYYFALRTCSSNLVSNEDIPLTQRRSEIPIHSPSGNMVEL